MPESQTMQTSLKSWSVALATAAATLCTTRPAHAALLAYEPFTNAPGTAVVGSADGFGFSGPWQSNSSGGAATNTAYPLGYTDPAGNILVTRGGAGFFQGLTSANTSMQPIRLLAFGRGTNGADGVTTWISFLAVRQGPAVAGNNPYPRGANVPHDLDAGALQKLAIGNSTAAATNTVGLIPLGNAGNLKPSAVLFSVTNFIVVRIDHVAGTANDNAYLFINPNLAVEPALGQANTNSLGSFDFSFDRLRVFAGGNASASQPYAELVVDEYRLGETYADVTPYATASNPPPNLNLIITNTFLTADGIALSGTGGTSSAAYLVLASADLAAPATAWPAIATNYFDNQGNFNNTNPIPAGVIAQFYRVQIAPPAVVVPPSIGSDPTNQTVLAGQNASFNVTATGTAPLSYQWFYNTNTTLANATNTTLVLNNVQSTNAGTYSVRVTNPGGSAFSAPATLTVLAPPSITSQPADQTVVAGDSATFTLAAAGTAPLRYQWYFNTNTPLANATNSSWTVINAQTNNAGAYSVMVTNNYGAATSSVARLTISQTVVTNGAFFVSPSGNDTWPGTIDQPFKTISKGLTAVGSGGQLYLRAGTYALSSKLTLGSTASATNRIRIWAYPGEVPVINSTGNSSDGISLGGRYYHLKGLDQKNAGHNGINISGHSNIIENCSVHDNGNTGLHITGGQSGSVYPSYNLITNCDAYMNYDPPVGGNADGFSTKWQVGPGNVFTGCRAWNNSDDGWDLWMGTSTVVIENCWAFRNGVDSWFSGQFDGNGNGFKLGGNNIGTPHLVRNCVSFDNAIVGSHGAGRGFDENNNLSGQTLYNCISYRNMGNNYHFSNTVTNGQHVIRNCISYVGNVNITSGTVDLNSWQGFTVADTDFLSLDTTLATAPRNADGSLPVTSLFRLAPGSSMIDAGLDVGLPYNGVAPDLGAFETSP
jgi:hypothetical protein